MLKPMVRNERSHTPSRKQVGGFVQRGAYVMRYGSCPVLYAAYVSQIRG